MRRLALSLLLQAASVACGFAALGLALYARGPSAMVAAQLFGAVGLLAGLLCGGLQLLLGGLPLRQARPLSAPAVAELVRATLASVAAERQPRSGSAADRRPVAAAAPLPAPRAAEAPRFASSAFGA